MTNYTPGPWNITNVPDTEWLCGHKSETPCLTAIDAIDPVDGRLFEVCAVWGINSSDEDSSVARSNARLIAAAPELLEALKAVADDFDGMVLMPGGLADRVRAAIAKAEGRV